MKTKMNFFILVFAIVFKMTAIPVNAQFVAATVQETAMSVGMIGNGNTGNDICVFNNDVFEVSVFDDFSSTTPFSGMAYRVNGGTPQTIAFDGYNSTIGGNTVLNYIDPDVCLLDDGSNLFAVAVYMANTVNSPDFVSYYMLECFKYNYSTGTFAPCTSYIIFQFSLATSYVALPGDFEINIDGVDRKFVVAWNDSLGNFVKANNGSIDGCAVVCNLASPDTIYYYNRTTNPGNPTHGLPDVAVNSEDSVYFTYLIKDLSNNSRFEVAHVRNGGSHGLCGAGKIHVTVAYNSGASGVGEYADPRVACPNLATSVTGASAEDYMVVVGETNKASQWKILGVNFYKSGSGLTVINYYNDGSGFSLVDLDDVINEKPVVTYDEDGYIMVGWMFDNLSGNYYPAQTAYYPIAIGCYSDGKISVSNYMDVPYLISPYDSYTSLSVAGRYYSDNLYTFYKSEDDLYTKTVAKGSSNLRIAASDDPATYSLELLLCNFYFDSDIEYLQFYLYIHDIAGKQIIKFNGNLNEMRREYNKLKKFISPGIYFGRINTADGIVNVSGKLMVQQ
jgi:hypothetical protein